MSNKKDAICSTTSTSIPTEPAIEITDGSKKNPFNFQIIILKSLFFCRLLGYYKKQNAEGV